MIYPPYQADIQMILAVTVAVTVAVAVAVVTSRAILASGAETVDPTPTDTMTEKTEVTEVAGEAAVTGTVIRARMRICLAVPMRRTSGAAHQHPEVETTVVVAVGLTVNPKEVSEKPMNQQHGDQVK